MTKGGRAAARPVSRPSASRRQGSRPPAAGLPGSAAAPGHGVEAALGGYVILNSYHCSRLNTNTGRLTPAMFEAIFRRAREIIES